jgi:transposase
MSIEVSNLDHLGLVAGLVDEIGIVALINEQLGEHSAEKISAGQVVKGMILNGLGLVSSPLYLFSRFFEGKATEHLLGKGIKAGYLNDDRLGRVLDSLYQTGLNQVFVSIVLEVAKKYEIEVGTVHLDSSSFQVQGEYATDYSEYSEGEEPRAIQITYGYSRDHRPDLKQFMMDLICSADGDVPLWMRIGDGNESDRQQFVQIMKDFKSQLNWDSLIVLDSAFYSQENLQSSQSISWLSRVPLTVKAACQLVRDISQEELKSSQLTGYRYKEVQETYGGIPQKWLVVESQKRRESDLKKLAKNLQKEALEAEKQLRQLSRQTFACIPDARAAAQKLLKKSKYHHLTNIQIEAVANFNQTDSTTPAYQVRGTVSLCEEKIKPIRDSAGRFIIATNVLDEGVLTAETMLSKYKGQQAVERGFRFLKDPMFLTDSVFLKSPERIEALGLIMGLCLLVYTLGQRQLRQNLQRRQSKIPNQLGRLTDFPTLRWLFQCFQSIHVLVVRQSVEISNLTDERLSLLKFFPPACQRYYLLS